MKIIDNLAETLQGNKIINLFSKLYSSDPKIIQTQIQRYKDLISQFKDKFSNISDDNIHIFSTPGRTEIGGNHTDHNHGCVLAASVDLDSIAAVSPTNSPVITVYSKGYKKPFKVDLTDLSVQEQETGQTPALIRGIAAKFKESGYNINGFKAYLDSNVLVGSGLSSSASIEILIGTILNHLYNNGKIDPVILAVIGQYAENKYFKKPCGLMDQIACAAGGIVNIDFKNNNKPVVKKVDFDFKAQNYHIVVIDTGGSHAGLTDDYAAIPQEMKNIASQLGKTVCREIEFENLYKNINSLRAKTGDRAVLRALHFIEENRRVGEQVSALEKGNFNTFLDLVNESGSSSSKYLQNSFTTKDPAQQGISLALGLTEHFIRKIGQGACRIHGGGFAGTIQVFMPDENLAKYLKFITGIFSKKNVFVLNIRPVGTLYINPLIS